MTLSLTAPRRFIPTLTTPTGVLPGHLDDQRFQLRPYSWSTGIAAVFGTVGLAGDQPPVPCQDSVRLGQAGHLCQSLWAAVGTDGTDNLSRSASLRRLIYHFNLLYEAVTDGEKPQEGPP
jgi:hypothetical protein